MEVAMRNQGSILALDASTLTLHHGQFVQRFRDSTSASLPTNISPTIINANTVAQASKSSFAHQRQKSPP